MDTRLFGQQLNGSFFSLGDAFGIILLVPVFEKLLLGPWFHGEPELDRI